MVQHYKICVNKDCEDANWRVLDGCSTGWIVTEIVKSKIYIYYIKDLSDLKNNETCLNFVDIPVCLPVNIQDYPRQCDYIAKKILGRFHSSIFYAPLKAWLGKSLEAINSICQNQSKPKLSKQSFNLFKKIIDVQKEYEKNPIFWQEIHPELLVHFYTGTNKLSKKGLEGQMQRLNILHKTLNVDIKYSEIETILNKIQIKNQHIKVKIDDILDSLFTAACINKEKYYKNLPTHVKIDNYDIKRRIELFKQN